MSYRITLPLAALIASAAATATLAQTKPAEIVGTPRAVSIAETAVNGKVIDAELDYEKGRLVYETTVATHRGGLHEVLIDARNGQVVSKRPLRAAGAWSRIWDGDRLETARKAAVALPQVLAELERETGSRVSEVSLEREHGQTYYEVELAQDGRHILIDPRTGARRAGEFDD